MYQKTPFTELGVLVFNSLIKQNGLQLVIDSIIRKCIGRGIGSVEASLAGKLNSCSTLLRFD